MSNSKRLRIDIENQKYSDNQKVKLSKLREEKYKDRREERRFQRAIKTKNISELIEEDNDYIPSKEDEYKDGLSPWDYQND